MTTAAALEGIAALTGVDQNGTLCFKNGAGPEISISSLEDLREYWVCGQNPAKKEVHLKRNSDQAIALSMNHYDALKAKYTGKDTGILGLIEAIELVVYNKSINITPIKPPHRLPK